MSPTRPGQAFIIIEIPDQYHLDAINMSTKFESLYNSNVIVFAILGPGIIEDPLYKQFSERFGPNSKHYVFDQRKSGHPVSFFGSAVSQNIFHSVCPKYFPRYQFSKLRDWNIDLDLSSWACQVAFPTPLMDIQIEPSFCVSSRSSRLDTVDIVSGEIIENSLELQGALNQAQPLDNDSNDWIIIPLGTGSSIPSKFRNVSSTLVSTSSGSILLDCGEGTVGQLSRIFSPQEGAWHGKQSNSLLMKRHPTLKQLLSSIKLVFVSHLHADHHIGLIRLFQETSHHIYIICPWRMWNYLKELNSFHPIDISRLTFIDSEHVLMPKDDTFNEYTKECASDDEKDGSDGKLDEKVHAPEIVTPILGTENVTNKNSTRRASIARDPENDNCLEPVSNPVEHLLSYLQLKSILTTRVIHRQFSYAIRFQCSKDETKSVLFSGDTRPCESLVQLGKAQGGTNLLIHEATFDSEMKEEAKKKAHSTTAEAIRVFERYEDGVF
jgi:ribonuclease Z